MNITLIKSNNGFSTHEDDFDSGALLGHLLGDTYVSEKELPYLQVLAKAHGWTITFPETCTNVVEKIPKTSLRRTWWKFRLKILLPHIRSNDEVINELVKKYYPHTSPEDVERHLATQISKCECGSYKVAVVPSGIGDYFVECECGRRSNPTNCESRSLAIQRWNGGFMWGDDFEE